MQKTRRSRYRQRRGKTRRLRVRNNKTRRLRVRRLTGGEITDPSKQRQMIDLIYEFLNNPKEAHTVTDDYLAEARKYINALRGTNLAVSDAVEAKITAEILSRSIAEPEKTPVGYNEKAAANFLQQVASDPRNADFKVYKAPERTLRNAKYYLNSKGEIGTPLYRTIVRGQASQLADKIVELDFRPPVNTRPDMPVVAPLAMAITSDFITKRIADIWSPITKPEKRIEAFNFINEIFLTDWVDRIGYEEKGQRYMHTPPYDNYDLLKEMKRVLVKARSQCKETEYSQRKQLFDALIKKIDERLPKLFTERLNKLRE